MGVTLKLTPQGVILLVKGIAGAIIGIVANFVYPEHIDGGRLFLISLIIYTLLSFATLKYAQQANPPISLGIYAFFKGFLTYYIALYISWLTIYNMVI